MNIEIDEHDRRLLLVIQEMPLRPWSHIAEVLGVAPREPQKRWRRVHAEWGARVVLDAATATFDAPHVLLDVHASPGQEWSVAEGLARLPVTEYVFLQSGWNGITAHLTPEPGGVRSIQDSLGDLPGITDYELTFITGTVRRFRHWQLQPATDVERDLVAAARTAHYAGSGPGRSGVPETINAVAGEALVGLLRRNARASIESLNTAENEARARAGLAPVSAITTRRERDHLLGDPTRKVSLRIRQRPWNYPLHTLRFSHEPQHRAELFSALRSYRDHVVYAVETTGGRGVRVVVSATTAAELEAITTRVSECGASQVVVERIHAAGFGAARVPSESIALRAVGSERL